MFGMSLAKGVNCHMITRMLNVILMDGTVPSLHTTHAIAVHSVSSSIHDKTTNNFRVQTEILRVYTDAISMNVHSS